MQLRVMPVSPVIITDSRELSALCQRLGSAAFVTVDTEFMRESTYYPQLCLIQVAGPAEAACIDPLAEGLDLTPFYDLMRAPGVLKVFHAARQDLEIFALRMGALPAPLFDTQVAAMVCGFGDSVGYDTLVARITGTTIDKSSRFTDWSRRPLTDKQVLYALADVTHLRDVYTALRQRLDESGRAGWLDQEMAILNDLSIYHTAPEDAWKRLKPRSSKPRFLAVLAEVASWRETEAQTRDLPRGRILRDEALEEIAAHPPATVEDLGRIRGLSKNWADGKMGHALLKAVEKGVALPLEQAPKLPPKQPLGHYSPALVELLKVLLRHVADESQVAARLIATTPDLEQIAAAGEKAETPTLTGWRRDLFGTQALALRQGKLALATHKDRIRLVPLET